MYDGLTALLQTVRTLGKRSARADGRAEPAARAEPVLEARKDAPAAHASGNREMFDRIAPRYDTMNKLMTLGIDRRWRARLVQMVGRGLSNEPAVLDLCAGTMDLAGAIEEAYPSARVVACDASPKMLELGADKVRRVEAVVGDALALPFADASFDVVVCGFGMRNLSDLKKGIREARRVLRPGGLFLTLEAFRPRAATSRLVHGAGLRYLLPVMGAAIANDREAYAYLADSMEGFVTGEAYAALLASEGFDSVRTNDLTLGMAAIVEGARTGAAP